MAAEDCLSQTLELKDGRRLGYAELGDPAGVPVVYCHGFPASRMEGVLIASAAERQRVRIIVPDRPGYGLSDWKPERSLAEWPNDVAELADALDLQRFSVLAVSGGAPYGLALAARLGERVVSTAVVCGLGPVFKPEALAPMHWPGRLGFQLAKQSPWLLHVVYGGILGQIMRAKPEFALWLLTIAMPEADRRTLARPEIGEMLRVSVREALRPGVKGALMDMVLYAGEWGFDPAAIETPIQFWHGEADATVPARHTDLLAASLPQASIRKLPEEGHFSLPIDKADEILATMLGL